MFVNNEIYAKSRNDLRIHFVSTNFLETWRKQTYLQHSPGGKKGKKGTGEENKKEEEDADQTDKDVEEGE